MASAAIPSPHLLHRLGRILFDYDLPLERIPEQLTDSDLADRMAKGDADALRAVHDKCSRAVFGYLVRFLRDRPAAEDVQQQVFLEVWNKADRFDGSRGSLLSWVMTIARSRAIDFARRRVPEPRDPGRTAELAGPDPGGDREMEEVVETWHFAQILSGIPSDEAELLRFRFQDELSQAEISARTGIPLGTVKSRMVSGLERLRVMMEAEK
jgi:RNA polymerase sigma-70 factor, ECF subfamily